MRQFVFDDAASGLAFGQAHGETFRGEIQSLAQLRMYLCRTVGGFASDDEVREAAQKHLPVLKAFSQDLYDELLGIAEGAQVTAEDVVVLNHYTDLRDLGRQKNMDDDGCSVLFARTEAGPVLAQTWDMHATAIPYVMMLRVPNALGVDAWVLSLTGCLGMAGMNAHGLGVAINNLHSTDAQIGVVWSALVRRMLQCADAEGARKLLLGARVGSGHHYLLADQTNAFGIETSGELRSVVFDGTGDRFVHTNHCLDDTVAKRSTVPEKSSTYVRLEKLDGDTAGRRVKNARDAYDRLGSQDGYPRSVCTNTSTPERPHGPATCAAISMDLAARKIFAVSGFPHNVEPEIFTVG